MLYIYIFIYIYIYILLEPNIKTLAGVQIRYIPGGSDKSL